MKHKDAPRVRRIAREVFGYDRLRPGQEAVIQSVIDGRDTLAVMPTGWGKSAIYQIAGVQRPGPTVVISPLIALQQDQLAGLEEQEVAGAAAVNSAVRAGERQEALEGVREGEIEFLFLTPEQFNNPQMLDLVREARPSLFVVDEAHCISEWGHDFRPDYLKLGAVIEALGHPPVLALTATAAPPVREEIVARLGMRDPRVVVRGFDRPNIWLGVERFAEAEQKTRALIERVADAEKPGIVYTATRKTAELIAGRLRGRGVRAAAYHAGMRAREREQVQAAFMEDELDAIVATIAFGMGVDKPNVRFVFHHDISESVDSYYQEIGRAGRDGEPARAVLFYRPEDLGVRRFFASSSPIEPAQVELVGRIVHEHGAPIHPRELREQVGLSQTKLLAALNRLAEAGAVEMLPTGEVRPGERAIDLRAAAEQAARAHEQRRRADRSRVEMIHGYAEVHDCRRRYLLNYFGEEFDGPCGRCDNCEAGVVVARDASSEPFPQGSRVSHADWGDGQVLRYEGNKMVVLFDQVGYKTLAIDLVTERGLLLPAA